MRRRTNYACLSQSYYRDEALTGCTPMAELLFVRAIAFCREQSSDGHFTDAQLTWYVGVRIPQPEKHAQQLVDAGLWERTEGGYFVRSFLAWNSSAEEVEQQRERDRSRKASSRVSVRNPDGIQTESERTPDGFRKESLDREEKRREEETLVATTPPRADVEGLCRKLADAIEANGSKRPTITQTWRDEARRLLDLDKRPLAEAVRLIAWAQGNTFWRRNVMSMPKFREQYDRLRLELAEEADKPAGRAVSASDAEPWMKRNLPRDAS